MQEHATEARDEGAELAALWRERVFPAQKFQPSPYPEALPGEDGQKEKYVTFAVISDTHGKHGKFAGYEVPVAPAEGINSTRGYFAAQGKAQNAVLGEIAKVVANASDDFLDGPLGTAPAQVHTGQLMSVVPIVLLSGNRKAVVPPPAKTVAPPEPTSDAGRRPAGSRTGSQEGTVIPYADVLIHCGDITMKGAEGEMESFCQFMAQLPHAHKVVIGGNHDITLDDAHFGLAEVKRKWKLTSAPVDLPKRLRKRLAQAGVVYLQDQTATLSLSPPPSLPPPDAGVCCRQGAQRRPATCSSHTGLLSAAATAQECPMTERATQRQRLSDGPRRGGT